MAVAVEVGIGHLGTEFRADTFILLCTLQPARAIATGAFQAVTDGLDHFLIFI